MNKPNSYWITSCILLLMFNVLLLAKSTKQIVNPSDNNNSDTSIADAYQPSFIDLLENDGLMIHDMTLLDIADNSVRTLSDLFGNDSVLFICRVSQYQCQSCASYAMEKAIELAETDTTGMKLVFFCEYEYRSLKILADEHPNLCGFCVYQTLNINLPIEDRTYPYYFTLSKNMKANDVFTPDMGDPVKTEIYWKCISGKWR